MTENYPEVTTPEPVWSGTTSSSTYDAPIAVDPVRAGYDAPAPTRDEPATADVAKEQAADLKSGAVEAGQNVAGVAKEQAGNVTAEAGKQAKDLLQQAQTEVKDQAGTQQQRLAGGLHTLADELKAMTQHGEQKGVATDLAQQASAKSHEIASWLEDRDPSRLLDELRSFARSRPGAFLAAAAGVGLVGGRLTRGLKAASSDDAPTSTATPAVPAPGSYSSHTGSAGAIGAGGYATTDRPFASSQDVESGIYDTGSAYGTDAATGGFQTDGDYPIPASTERPAWSDESDR